MAAANKRKVERTHEGAPAKSIDARAQLERSVMSCLLWENEFYEDGKTISERIAELVKKVPASEVADITIRAKRDMRLRHIPLFLARELARTKAGKKELAGIFPHIIKRADEPGEFLALYWKDGKVPLAKQVKKHLGEAFRKFDEYQLAKYNGGQRAVKLRDVLRILRPKPLGDEQAALWKKVVSDTLSPPDTWEVSLSKGGGKKTDEQKKEHWERLLKEGKLGGLAMLRNLRNMREAKVEDGLIITGISNINAGKLLPINFIAAAKHNPSLEQYIEKKFLECFTGKEKMKGKTLVLVDVSVSMDSALSEKSELNRMDVACSLAMIGREMFEHIEICTFSDRVVQVPARQGFALRDAIWQSQAHSGTQLGAALKQIGAGWDRIIVITDEQSHDRVPDMKGYMINVASAKNGVGYGAWIHIDGWSDKVLDYIARYESSISA